MAENFIRPVKKEQQMVFDELVFRCEFRTSGSISFKAIGGGDNLTYGARRGGSISTVRARAILHFKLGVHSLLLILPLIGHRRWADSSQGDDSIQRIVTRRHSRYRCWTGSRTLNPCTFFHTPENLFGAVGEDIVFRTDSAHCFP